MSNEILQLNEQAIRTELKELVCQCMEERSNGLLDAEADRLTNAHKVERMEDKIKHLNF